MKLSYPNRQASREAMETSITPLARALRRFGAGKPIARPTDTPLGVVLLATEQRERLRGILDSEDIESPRITGAAIVVRLEAPGAGTPFDDDIVLIEGAESYAVRDLERHIEHGHKFTISGLIFVVQTGADVRVFSYRIERTREGEAALKSAGEKLIPRRRGPSDTR